MMQKGKVDIPDTPVVQRSKRDDVVRLYRELLDREPESETVIWEGCERSLLELALEFARTEEFRLVARRTTGEDVVRLYRELLEREPESETVVSERCGRPLLELAIEFAQTQEFRLLARRSTREDVVELYRELLGREPESETVVSERCGRPLLELAIEFALTEEFRVLARQSTREDVITLYRNLLNREPESETVIAERCGRPLLELALEFVQTEETRLRQLLRPQDVQALYSVFFPAVDFSIEWRDRFSKILETHLITIPQLVAYFNEMSLHQRGSAQGYSAILQSLANSKTRRGRLRSKIKSKVKVVVPTINSEKWIGALIDYYDQINADVTFAVDNRTADRTREVISQRNRTFVDVTGEWPRVESLLANIVSKVDSAWILRFDDDELPSPGLLSFVDEAANLPESVVLGFPRVHCRWDPANHELQYSQFLPLGPFAGCDVQWRLFSRNGVEFEDRLHSSGIVSKESRRAPRDAIIFHFDWVLRSHTEKLRKVAAYSDQNAKVAEALAHICLYELVPEDWHMFVKLKHRPFVDFARKVHHVCSGDTERAVLKQ